MQFLKAKKIIQINIKIDFKRKVKTPELKIVLNVECNQFFHDRL